MRMRSQGNSRSRPHTCVVIDVNTQRDFLEPEGSCQVANHEQLVGAVRRTVAWVKRNQVPVISAVDCHRAEEIPNGGLPRHCVDGTTGQDKVVCTMMGSYVWVESDCTLAVPIDLFSSRQQVIFRKRTEDLFRNLKADRFITQLNVEEYLIFGLALERSIKSIALGLAARNKKVTVVFDACGYWNQAQAELSVRQMAAKGIKFCTLDEAVSRRLSRVVRYPRRCTDGMPMTLRNGVYASTTAAAALPKAKQRRRAPVNGESRVLQ